MQIRHPEIRQGTQEAVVTPLELFFDLVFVYAFFNVARATSANLTAIGLVHAVLILALLWWCWCSRPR